MDITAKKSAFTLSGTRIIWAAFIIWCFLSGYGMLHHELWGDEFHSWNIAKASAGYGDLISNTRYEGHPPVWYTILWSISKLTHNIACIQVAHWIISALIVFIVLFYSPFPLISRMLIPFGYYFLFEYAILSRNYAIGVLLAFCICMILHKDFRYKLPLYYVLLFLMSNTHLLALMLAGSLHLYFLLLNFERKEKAGILVLHILLGILVSIPALYFIFPPSDSQLNMHFWMDKWNIHQLVTFGQGPLRAFIPIPAWWEYHFWNTQFLLEAKENHRIFKLINPVILLLILLTVFFILRKNKKSLALFGTNLALTFIVAVAFFPLTCARHAGFIYIGFIAAYWLYCHETPVNRNNKRLVNMLLVIQLIAGAIAVSKDNRLPFSNAYRAKELLNKVPESERTVTDYWTLNVLSAFIDKPFYCIDLQKEQSFLLWDNELAARLSNPHRYTDGLQAFFQKEGIKKAFLISITPSQKLFQLDSLLSQSFQFTLVGKREGAVEKGGDLYLYQVSAYVLVHK